MAEAQKQKRQFLFLCILILLFFYYLASPNLPDYYDLVAENTTSVRFFHPPRCPPQPGCSHSLFVGSTKPSNHSSDAFLPNVSFIEKDDRSNGALPAQDSGSGLSEWRFSFKDDAAADALLNSSDIPSASYSINTSFDISGSISEASDHIISGISNGTMPDESRDTIPDGSSGAVFDGSSAPVLDRSNGTILMKPSNSSSEYASISKNSTSFEELNDDKSRIICRPNEPQGADALPKELLESANTWYHVSSDQTLVDISIPVLKLSQLNRDDRVRETPPTGSTAELIGKTYYKLSNFCVVPENYGGILLYGRDNDTKTTIEICNEFDCKPYKISIRKSSPPSDALWVTTSTALIKCFTDNNPWHALQHLLSISKLLNNPDTLILNSSVHLYPTFVDVGISKIGYRVGRVDPFRGKYFSVWPLLSAAVPEGTTMSQMNILSDLTHYRRNLPKVCYRHGYLDGPSVRLEKLTQSPRSLKFGQIELKSMAKFRSRALKMLHAEKLNSGWCPGKLSRRRRPVLGLVVRRNKRVLCNIAALAQVAVDSGFEVQLIRFENMTIQEQIYAVRLVDVLAGMHGAGLTQIFWARKGSVLVEIYPSNGPILNFGVNTYPTSNYGAWALASGSTHIAIGSRIPGSLRWRERDVYMDVNAFAKMMNASMSSLLLNRSCDDIL